ncbi:MAG TPA: Holliday junction branch migration DNA helicase RuvB [Planctomycetaceae bacterium]|nr:Holliday junction branch migration DNA helicase RuvB [Planctomycetaceae bacterium]
MAREPIIRNGDDESHPQSSGRARRGQGRASSRRSPPPSSPPTGFSPDDDQHDDELRPQRLEDVVGQRKVIERLRIMIDATKKRKQPLGHVLFDGPPGIGKTTLATVLPRELGVDVQIASGPALSAPKDLLPYLTNCSYASVLFIDEIHRLPAAVEEFLYPAMEDFRVDIALGEGLNARTINMKLQPFTVIGATTRSGMLTGPLRDRFVNREHLDFYDLDDLTEIVTRNAKKLRTSVTREAAHEISRRSRGTPRKANNLLYWARDFADHRNSTAGITLPLAREALAMKEVDELGLDPQDRKYMQTIITVFSGGPAGLQAIAHTMNIAPDTLEDEVEPFLLRAGLIQRTPRGRMVTAAALEHLGFDGPDAAAGGSAQRALF